MSLGVVFDSEKRIPAFKSDDVGKLEVALTVKDVTALKLLVSAYAMSVLAEYDVSAVFSHSATCLS